MGINLSKFKIIDHRLQEEVNTVIYTDTGRVDHDKGCHDDLVIATALALMGIDQVSEVKEIVLRKKPRNNAEALKFEADTGLLMSELGEGYFQEENSFWDGDQDAPPGVPFRSLT